MKKLLLTFLIFITHQAYSQSGIAIYKVYSTFKTEKPVLIKNLKYKLVFNSDSYIFTKNNELSSDFNEINNKVLERRVSNGIFFRNMTESFKINQIILFGKNILKKDTLYDSYWTLTNTNKLISKYNCKHAFLKIKDKKTNYHVKIEAWYSPDISLPYGPNGFDGLPGLIVKLKRDNVIFVLDDIKFYDSKIKIHKPVGEIMNEEELLDFASKHMNMSKKNFKEMFREKSR